MSNSIWTKLEEYFQTYPQDMAQPAITESIGKAEDSLGVNFQESYKTFLKKYGGACIGSKLLYGMEKQKDMDEKLSTVINVTNFYRSQSWPDIEDWYVISDDFDGNPIGCKPDGSVWLSDHDAGFEQIKLADNFEEFLHKLLTDTLYQ
ncbi:MAG: SMI1/KNR4 family protein [Alphaproteobacteria bacterium]|nr:SMI1/KNR4 family protein [Alphaproteobacteria bacterium]